LCLDSNVVAKWVFDEELAEAAEAFWVLQTEGQVVLVAPDTFLTECVSIVRHKLVFAGVPAPVCSEALEALLLLHVRVVGDAQLYRRTLDIALQVGEDAWDAVYIAVAEAEGCDFWTADRDLASRAKPHFPFVKLLGEDAFEQDAP